MAVTASAKPTLAASADVADALALLMAGDWSPEDYGAWDATRQAAKAVGKLYCKTSRKGGLSLYGLNAQFPVTLYAEQWATLFGFREQIEAHIAADKPQVIAAEYETDKATGAKKLVKVEQTVRLKRKGEAENAHVLS